MPTFLDLCRVVAIGVGATAVMDLWLLVLAAFGITASNFGLIGRWVAHMGNGRFVHVAIAQAQPVPGELALGWITHYAVGVAYAVLFVLVVGLPWMLQPTLLPALVFGVLTVAVPFFVMQPAMGAGIAATKTATPLLNAVRSLANHTVFGAGLYLTAAALQGISR